MVKSKCFGIQQWDGNFYFKKYWDTSFRPPQDKIIASILSGKDTFALLPTGGGKSICYQFHLLCCLKEKCRNFTFGFLMLDQVKSLEKEESRQKAIHSGLSSDEVDIILDNFVHGPLKLLYISPERIASEVFQVRFCGQNSFYSSRWSALYLSVGTWFQAQLFTNQFIERIETGSACTGIDGHSNARNRWRYSLTAIVLKSPCSFKIVFPGITFHFLWWKLMIKTGSCWEYYWKWRAQPSFTIDPEVVVPKFRHCLKKTTFHLPSTMPANIMKRREESKMDGW